jgi:hypothetical protein
MLSQRLNHFSLKNEVKVPSKRNEHKNFLVGIFKVTDEKSMIRSRILSQRYGSKDLDPYPDSHQNVTDPEHWFLAF